MAVATRSPMTDRRLLNRINTRLREDYAVVKKRLDGSYDYESLLTEEIQQFDIDLEELARMLDLSVISFV